MECFVVDEIVLCFFFSSPSVEHTTVTTRKEPTPASAVEWNCLGQ